MHSLGCAGWLLLDPSLHACSECICTHITVSVSFARTYESSASHAYELPTVQYEEAGLNTLQSADWTLSESGSDELHWRGHHGPAFADCDAEQQSCGCLACITPAGWSHVACALTPVVWLVACACRMLQLGESASGRDEIATTMNLCGNSTTALPDQEAVLGLQNDVIGTFQGLAQVRAAC